MKILLIFLVAVSMSCQSTSTNQPILKEDKVNRTKGKILFVLSNAQFYGASKIKTANHFSEIVLPYDVLAKAEYTIDFVSPQGGPVPLGYIDTSDVIVKQHLDDPQFMDLFEHTKNPSEVNPANYKAIFYAGGGSAMFGVPENKSIQNIAMEIYEKHNGIISTICHGTAGIVHLKKQNGEYLVKDKEVNGFPDKFESMQDEYYQEFPFSIEQIVQERGGQFSYSEQGWDAYYVKDGKLITGQDPSGASIVATKIVEALEMAPLKS